MKIAIIGTGIAGNVAAHLLAPVHDLTLFESNDYVGGHTNTVTVAAPDGPHDVDTGFIVFNEENYPEFTRLLRRLGVASSPSNMSFSMHSESGGLEYASHALLARRRNALDPGFARMLADIARFNRASRQLLRDQDTRSLGDFLRGERYSRAFVDSFLYPMGGAIWSCDPARMAEFPVAFLARFFQNHRFLDLFGQPQWRVVQGGSKRYVEALTRPFADRVRLSSAVRSITRSADRVVVKADGQEPATFDHVVIAAHADDALGLLDAPTPEEREILGAFEFQENVAVLHTDTSLMPKRRRAWAAWNVRRPISPLGRVAVTYDMNILQGLRAEREYLVTLNDTAGIASDKRLGTYRYRHPMYSARAVAAQRRHKDISGHHRTSYCGAYWGFGFHEDGVVSALAVGRELGRGL